MTITSDPAVMVGKPVIAGACITVELILEKLGNVESIDHVISSYQRLTREAVIAALKFAAQVMRADVVYPVERKSV